MIRPPSKKQLGYLKGLGYKGEPPETMGEASAAIEEMLESGDSKKAERAIERMRREEERDKKKQGKRKFAAIKAQIRSMIRENKVYGDEGLFTGFRFEAIDEDEIDEEERPYLGAFVPLEVAAKFPEILLKETLDLEEMLCDDNLPVVTKKIVAPGQYTIMGAWFPNSIYKIPKPVPRTGAAHPSRKRERDEEEDEWNEAGKPDEYHPPPSSHQKKPEPWQVLIGCLIMIAAVVSLLCCCPMVVGLIRQ